MNIRDNTLSKLLEDLSEQGVLEPKKVEIDELPVEDFSEVTDDEEATEQIYEKIKDESDLDLIESAATDLTPEIIKDYFNRLIIAIGRQSMLIEQLVTTLGYKSSTILESAQAVSGSAKVLKNNKTISEIASERARKTFDRGLPPEALAFHEKTDQILPFNMDADDDSLFTGALSNADAAFNALDRVTEERTVAGAPLEVLNKTVAVSGPKTKEERVALLMQNMKPTPPPIPKK